MQVIKNQMSYVLKLFINHFVSGVYSLILFVFFTIALEGKLQIASSVLSVLFYLYLVYSFMWEAGAKRGVGFDSKNIKKTDGIKLMAAGSSVFAFSTVLCTILSFFASGAEFAERTVDVIYRTLFYFNVFFSQCMYSGAFSVIFGTVAEIPAFMYLISLIPGFVVAGLAYNLGSQNKRLRRFFGIKYNEEKEKIRNNY